MRVFLFLLVAAFLSACSSGSVDNQWKSVDFHSKVSNRNPNIDFEFDGVMQLPACMEGVPVDSLRDNIIAASLGSVFSDFRDSRLLKVYADSSFCQYVGLFADYVAEEGDTVELETIPCVTNLNARVKFQSDLIVVYETALYVYSGGAHGMTTFSNSVFDLSSGRLVREEDIFKGDYRRKLHNLLVRYAAPLRNDSILPAELDPYFNDSLIQPNGNVWVTDSSIVYTFNPYEIAPYCFGAVDVEIPREEVVSIADSASVVFRHLFN